MPPIRINEFNRLHQREWYQLKWKKSKEKAKQEETCLKSTTNKPMKANRLTGKTACEVITCCNTPKKKVRNLLCPTTLNVNKYLNTFEWGLFHTHAQTTAPLNFISDSTNYRLSLTSNGTRSCRSSSMRKAIVQRLLIKSKGTVIPVCWYSHLTVMNILNLMNIKCFPIDETPENKSFSPQHIHHHDMWKTTFF